MSRLQSHLQNVEGLLALIARDLREIEGQDADENDDDTAWKTQLDAFRTLSTSISKVFARFRNADTATRRYLKSHLEEDFESLEQTYASLREMFLSDVLNDHTGETSWDGSYSPS